MFDTLEIFDLATARAQHAAMRQNVIAGNIANADTPDYRARTVTPFEDIYRSLQAGGRLDDLARIVEADRPNSPNGNSVSLELEMVASIDAQRVHSRSLNVYRSALNVLRTGLGR